MDIKRKKIVVISVSAGAGHVRAAEAIRETAALHFPELEVVHLDAMNYVSSVFRKTYKEKYLKIIEYHPSLWGYMYRKSDRIEGDDSKMKKFRLAIERLSSVDLINEIERINPDGIICTHFLPPELISRKIRKGKLDVPCWVQVTDFDVHGLWIQPRMEGYFVACEEAAWKLRENQIDLERIHVTGIPIVPQFSAELSKKVCSEELGISSDVPTILMMSGGFGVGDMYSLAERILKTKIECRIIALAGKNEELLKSLNLLSEEYNGKLIPMGFTTTIERIMAASDIAVTKPGGLTSSECLAMGLPMIIISPIPGQEERNADYLLENGVALKALDAAGLEYKIRRLLKNAQKRREMKENALKIANANAARSVLDTVVRAL